MKRTTGIRPRLPEFWNQRGGISLVAIEGNHLESAKKLVCIPKYDDAEVRLGSVLASPADLVDKLRRRERGPHSRVSGIFHSDGWTVIIEELGGMLAAQPKEALRLARLCESRVIAAMWEDEDRCVGLIVASPSGIETAGYSTATSRGDNPKPRVAQIGKFKPHPVTYGDPTPSQLRDALKGLGFDPAKHVLDERDIVTVFRQTRSMAIYDPRLG